MTAVRVPVLFAAVLVACSTQTTVTPFIMLDDGLPTSCSPLRVPGDCMMPFPNAIDLAVDASSKTGFRLALQAEQLPIVAFSKEALDPAPWNLADGFSPATPILYHFAERIDAASLVVPSKIETSITPQSPTVIVDMATSTLVAHFSEIDQTAPDVDGVRQGMMIRPVKRLAPNHRYAVGITNAVRTVDGKTPAGPPLFRPIADGKSMSDARAKAQAERMPEILKSIGAAGVDTSKLLVAWDFVTGSDEYLTSHLLSMRDQALAAGSNGIGFTITKVEENPNSDSLRIVHGTFTTPSFMTDDDANTKAHELVFDAAGKPKLQRNYEAPFTMIIPKSAVGKKLPLMLFGHGLLGNGDDILGGQKFANDKGYILFATDWIGLSKTENPLSTVGSGAIADALKSFNHVAWVTDRLQQSIINAMVLAQTVRGKMVNDPVMSDTGMMGGTPIGDPAQLVYWGISLGGIMGNALMGYEPDITRAVLGVPGGNWSLMIQRSSQWPQFKLLLGGSYPDYLDVQLLLALAQMRFDFSDPITTASRVILDPLPGSPKKQILIHLAVGDSQVPNLSTDLTARTEGIPLLGPTARQAWGLPETMPPQPSGMVAWDIHAMPLPGDTNMTPTSDNGAHGGIHSLPKLQDQLDHFLRQGEVIWTCDGPCDPQ